VDVRGEQVPFGAGPAQPPSHGDYTYEPHQERILDALLHRHFTTQLYRALIESVASEHGARMSAMDNATKNAGEMVASLTLTYNRARQAAITKELMEIIGGAEALK
jgi:F-type H+-transporting ATPase subunit gamma